MARKAAGTVTLAEAFDQLGISESTGRRLVRTGEFPIRTVLIGKRRRVLVADLDRYLRHGRDGRAK